MGKCFGGLMQEKFFYGGREVGSWMSSSHPKTSINTVLTGKARWTAFPWETGPPHPLPADKSTVGIWQRQSHLESDHRVWEELKAEIFVGYVRGSCPGGLILLTERGGGAAGVGTMMVLRLTLTVRERGQVGGIRSGV